MNALVSRGHRPPRCPSAALASKRSLHPPSSSTSTRFSSYLASTCSRRLSSRLHPSRLAHPKSSSLFLLSRRQAHFDLSHGLSEDQLAYQQTALAFAASHLAPHAAEWDRTHTFPIDTLHEAAALGFGGVYVRDDVGGSGLGRRDGSVIFESLATGDVSTAAYLTIHNMVAWMIDAFGSDEQRRRYLPQLCSMQLLASYCLTEPGSGSDAASLQTTARQQGDEYVLNGSKAFISGGGASDVYVVMARTGGAGAAGISAFILEKGTAGLSFGKAEDKLGWNSQPTRAVIMEEVRVPASQLLGQLGSGFRIAMRGLDGGRVNIGTTALGGAVSCFNYALDYCRQRRQFQSAIADFQHTQFRFADMMTQLTAARLMVGSAATMMDSGHADQAVHCAMAKRFATDVAFNVSNSCLQLLGGYGYLREYPIERIMRDVRVHQILEGTNEIMQLIIARHVVKEK